MATPSTSILIGDDLLIANLEVLEKDMNKKIAKALFDFGGHIESESVKKTPIDTGELRSRVFNEGPLLQKEVYTQVIGYEKHTESFKDQYAVPVHERSNAKHPVGEAKFLEKAIDENASEYAKFMQKEIKISRLK